MIIWVHRLTCKNLISGNCLQGLISFIVNNIFQKRQLQDNKWTLMEFMKEKSGTLYPHDCVWVATVAGCKYYCKRSLRPDILLIRFLSAVPIVHVHRYEPEAPSPPVAYLPAIHVKQYMRVHSPQLTCIEAQYLRNVTPDSVNPDSWQWSFWLPDCGSMVRAIPR